jgi:hypothetical protein
MKANSWPAFQRRSSRTALGIEIWNFEDSVAVSDIIFTNLDRSRFGKKIERDQLRKKADQVVTGRTPAIGVNSHPSNAKWTALAPYSHSMVNRLERAL